MKPTPVTIYDKKKKSQNPEKLNFFVFFFKCYKRRGH